jgi:hypothetical protein
MIQFFFSSISKTISVTCRKGKFQPFISNGGSYEIVNLQGYNRTMKQRCIQLLLNLNYKTNEQESSCDSMWKMILLSNCGT